MKSAAHTPHIRRTYAAMIHAMDRGIGRVVQTLKETNQLEDTLIVSALDLVPTFTAAAGGKPLPLKKAPSHEDVRNRNRSNEKYGEYDGRDLLPALNGGPSPERLLFWRLQGQTAILDGEFKLIRPSHRPAQLFQPATDPGERNDVTANYLQKRDDLFQKLAEWEALRATVPLWGSSPTWNKDSPKIFYQNAMKNPQAFRDLSSASGTAQATSHRAG
ncbi:MAG: sulfatase-like hydrolase/transferase [Akkermansiaceae bacterium]